MRHDHGGSSEALLRRDFLKRVSMVGLGSCLLTGCDAGCSKQKSRDVIVQPIPAESEDVERPIIPVEEPDIRVRIATVRSPTEPLLIDNDSDQHHRWVMMRQVGTQRIEKALQSPITVQRLGDEWIVSESTGLSPTIDRMCQLEFFTEPRSDSRDPNIMIGDRSYPGKVRLVATDGASVDETDKPASDFDVMNYIGVERYLPGVLAKELYQHWHAETFAAQAIAARSFVIAEMQFYQNRRHFDVTATQQSQAYIGNTDLKVALEAGRKTRGIVLSWDKTLVPGYYSSCCGGIAANGVDGIGPNPINDIPPLRTRAEPDACKDAPVYSWNVTRSHDDLLKRLRAYGKSYGEKRLAEADVIDAIEVIERNAYGRPTKFRVETMRGTKKQITLIDARRLRGLIDYRGSGLSSPKTRLKSSFVKIDIAGNGSVNIDGRGFGHGVGLCQYGAEALANRGISHEQMLPMFYPEAELVAAYGGGVVEV